MSSHEELFPSHIVQDIDIEGKGLCEGYEEEITKLMGRLNDPDLQLGKTVRNQMQYRIECLNQALENRNKRLDDIGGPIWQGM